MAIRNAIGSDPLEIQIGGTLQNTLLANGILVGQGLGAISSINGATNGDLFIGATGNAPDWAALTSDDGSVTITPGVNSVTLSAATVGNVQTWIPTLTLTPTKSITYNTRQGQYTRVGDLIYWIFYLNVTITSPAGSSARVTGLPGNYNLNIPRYYFPAAAATTGPLGSPQEYCYLDTATGFINFVYNQPSTNNASAVLQNATATREFTASGFYFTN